MAKILRFPGMVTAEELEKLENIKKQLEAIRLQLIEIRMNRFASYIETMEIALKHNDVTEVNSVMETLMKVLRSAIQSEIAKR